jgi:fatty acid desaturase
MSDSRSFKLPPAVIQRLTQRSNAKGFTQLAAHLALLVLAGFALGASQDSMWLLVTLPIYAALLIFLFAALHETIHYTVFRTRWLNHRHTQNPELDPELLDMRPLIRRHYWWYLSGLPTWWQALKSIWRHATVGVDEPYIEPRHHSMVINEARLHLAGYALLLLLSLLYASTFLWWYWILPALLGQPLLRLYLLAEHSGCDLGANMLENSRTTYTVPWLNFLAWNMPYHAEHHYLASVPFHALPALHAYTGQRVKYRGDGYYRVNREIAARQ